MQASWHSASTRFGDDIASWQGPWRLDQRFDGTRRDDTLVGTSRDDDFYPLLGHDTVDGRGGHDVLRLDYSATATGSYDHSFIWSDRDYGYRATLFGDASSCEARNVEWYDVRLGQGTDRVSIAFERITTRIFMDAGGGTDVLKIDSDGTSSNQSFFLNTFTNKFEIKLNSGPFGTFGNFESVEVSLGSGNDYLGGAHGNDRLDGRGGDDRLEGGKGADRLTGGEGADTFFFDRPALRNAFKDVITDFSSEEGDTIQFVKALPRGGSFTFVGDDAFSATPGVYELRSVLVSDGRHRVEGDVNADGTADFAITVNSAAALVESDFRF